MAVAGFEREWARQQRLYAAVLAVAVVLFALALRRWWIVVPAAMLVLVRPVREALGQALARLTRERAARVAQVKAWRSARAGHAVVSPPVGVAGTRAMVSFDRGTFFVTDADRARELFHFTSAEVRDVGAERYAIAGKKGRTVGTGARVFVSLSDVHRPMVQLDFGQRIDAAREWKARFLAARDASRTVIEGPGKVVVREVKVRCPFCRSLVDADKARCTSCGAPL